MTNKTFVAKLTRGAMASTIAGACLLPRTHSANNNYNVEAAQSIAVLRQESSQGAAVVVSDAKRSISFGRAKGEWTKSREREFRALALKEAAGTLSQDEASRLEYLSLMRERLDHPRSGAEILSQLQRERLLEKVGETLKQYVEFCEAENHKRPPAR